MDHVSGPLHPLGVLRRGDRGVVRRVNAEGANRLHPLLDMGFIEGAVVRVLHEGPIGRDPMAVQVGDCRVALRRSEAGAILVELATPDRVCEDAR